MNVQYRQRLCIGECRHFDCLDCLIPSLEVVLRGLLPFEERTVKGDMVGVELLLESAQERPPNYIAYRSSEW